MIIIGDHNFKDATMIWVITQLPFRNARKRCKTIISFFRFRKNKQFLDKNDSDPSSGKRPKKPSESSKPASNKRTGAEPQATAKPKSDQKRRRK